MRLASVIVAIVVWTAAARGDVVKQYAGRIVISPDPPPTIASELRSYLAANATKDNAYEAIKGSPWQIHLVGALSAEPKTAVTLELVDDKQAVLHALDVAAKRRLVISSTSLTTAAGFEANKTYVVRLVAGKQTLAKAKLRLRE